MRLGILAVLLTAVALNDGNAQARPQCITAAALCVEFVTVPPGTKRILVYRSHPLTAPNDSITRATIVVHGADRSARFEFRSALAGAFIAGALDYTVIVAPRFSTNDGTGCSDSLATNELNWECDVMRVDWRLGGVARNDSTLSTFDAVDALVKLLASKAVFPNLKSIVLAGHSAGGQFIALYALANQLHGRVGVDLSYAVANSASYPYFDDMRPTQAWVSSSNTPDPGDTTKVPFASFAGSSACPASNSWPFGLGNRPRYAARLSEEQLKRQLVERPVAYLLSQLDVTPFTGGYYGACAGMLQGSTRLARGVAYHSYVSGFTKTHRKIIVDGCAHDSRCVWTSDDVVRTLFPRR